MKNFSEGCHRTCSEKLGNNIDEPVWMSAACNAVENKKYRMMILKEKSSGEIMSRIGLFLFALRFEYSQDGSCK